MLPNKSKSILFPICKAARVGLWALPWAVRCPFFLEGCLLTPGCHCGWPCSHIWGSQWCADESLSGRGGGTAWICDICRFVRCKYFHHDWFQTTKGLTITCKRIPECLTISSWKLVLVGWRTPLVLVYQLSLWLRKFPLGYKHKQGTPEILMVEFLAQQVEERGLGSSNLCPNLLQIPPENRLPCSFPALTSLAFKGRELKLASTTYRHTLKIWWV